MRNTAVKCTTFFCTEPDTLFLVLVIVLNSVGLINVH